MAQKQAAGPTDVAAAVVEGGKLLIIDGRGLPWTFEAGEVPGPDGATVAFVLNERLHVLSGNVVWTYYPGSGWVEGNEVDTTVEGEGVGQWTKGHSIESRAVVEDEEGPTPKRKKAKEHA